MKKVKKAIKPIKVAAFLVLLAVIVSAIQYVLSINEYRFYDSVRGFYEEPDNSLDAVYLGASNVYAYWEAPLAFSEYGMTAYSYATSNMPPAALKYMIEEVRKSQPDTLFIINLNIFKNTEVGMQWLHYLLDYMPFSFTKLRMMNDLASRCEEGEADKLEFLFPVIRFHSRWNKLTTDDFYHPREEMKGSSTYKSFLGRSMDVREIFTATSAREAAEPEQEEQLLDLLNYCDENKVKILFVVVPQAIDDETVLGQFNTFADIAENRGYPVLHMESDPDIVGLDLSQDFYNEKHTNVHGALKFSHCLGSYLMENYHFEDKRGDERFASWTTAADNYNELILPYTLDFERLHGARDTELEAPKLQELKITDQRAVLSWEASEGADGYLIYRKYVDPADGEYTAWEPVGKTEKDTLEYEEQNLLPGTTYVYTVVPVARKNGTDCYGHFSYAGVKAATA